jgi:hypothetical protein
MAPSQGFGAGGGSGSSSTAARQARQLEQQAQQTAIENDGRKVVGCHGREDIIWQVGFQQISRLILF